MRCKKKRQNLEEKTSNRYQIVKGVIMWKFSTEFLCFLLASCIAPCKSSKFSVTFPKTLGNDDLHATTKKRNPLEANLRESLKSKKLMAEDCDKAKSLTLLDHKTCTKRETTCLQSCKHPVMAGGGLSWLAAPGAKSHPKHLRGFSQKHFLLFSQCSIPWTMASKSTEKNTSKCKKLQH